MLRIAEHVDTTSFDGELILVDLASGHYHGLDPVASLVWRVIAEGGDSFAVVSAILEQYEASAETVERDVEALVKDWLDRGWLIVLETTPGAGSEGGH